MNGTEWTWILKKWNSGLCAMSQWPQLTEQPEQGQQDPASRPEQPSSLSRWHHAWWNRGTSENLHRLWSLWFWSFEPPNIPEQDHWIIQDLYFMNGFVIQWQMFCLQWYAMICKMHQKSAARGQIPPCSGLWQPILVQLQDLGDSVLEDLEIHQVR